MSPTLPVPAVAWALGMKTCGAHNPRAAGETIVHTCLTSIVTVANGNILAQKNSQC